MRPPQIVALVFLALVLTGGAIFVSAGMLQNPRADELFNGAFYRDVGNLRDGAHSGGYRHPTGVPSGRS